MLVVNEIYIVTKEDSDAFEYEYVRWQLCDRWYKVLADQSALPEEERQFQQDEVGKFLGRLKATKKFCSLEHKKQLNVLDKLKHSQMSNGAMPDRFTNAKISPAFFAKLTKYQSGHVHAGGHSVTETLLTTAADQLVKTSLASSFGFMAIARYIKVFSKFCPPENPVLLREFPEISVLTTIESWSRSLSIVDEV